MKSSVFLQSDGRVCIDLGAQTIIANLAQIQQLKEQIQSAKELISRSVVFGRPEGSGCALITPYHDERWRLACIDACGCVFSVVWLDKYADASHLAQELGYEYQGTLADQGEDWLS